MQFIKHPQCNYNFGPPKGVSGNDCGTLPVKQWQDPDFGQAYTSFWRPSEAELKALNDGGSIALTIYGPGHPMLSMQVRAKESES